MTEPKVVLQPYTAEYCDIVIRYKSGKSWAKYTTVNRARYKARTAAKHPATEEIRVHICTGAVTVEKVHYHEITSHVWTKATGWVTTVSNDTNNGQGV